MTDQKRDLLHLCVLEQRDFKTIAQMLCLPNSTLSEWYEKLKEERQKIADIRKLWRRKKIKMPFGDFYKWLIRLVSMRFTDLIPGVYQIHLYDDTQELINYYRAVDSIKNRFGEDLLIRAAGYEPKPDESIARKLMNHFKI